MRLHLAILRSAALLVPAPQRAEWLQEWRAELWHVKQKATAFCLGAFRDAFWIRRNNPGPNLRRSFVPESPLRCLSCLAILAAATVFLAFRLSLPREILLPSPYRDARNLVTLAANGRFHPQVPTVPIEQYRALAGHLPPRFTGLAWYRRIRARVQSADLPVAVASANLFELLGIPISTHPKNSLVLSHDAWRKHFGGRPQVVGSVVEIAGQSAVVAGVLPAGAWRLGGQLDAWLLQDDPQLPPRAMGFVVGRLGPASSPPAPALEWRLDVPNSEGGYHHFQCSPLVTGHLGLAYAVPFALLLLAAFTPLATGEYPPHRQMRLRRWAFLAAKIVLVLTIAFCGSLDLATFVAPVLQPHGLLVGLIAGLRWALVDQRQRCPVCLHRLSNPTRIGGASHTFLEWYGTELMCLHGHGLLYVPEIATSCYSTPRWQHLDASWSTLFSA